MSDTVDFEIAKKMLPDGDEIHTFRDSGFALLGADWERQSLLSAMQQADQIHLTGPQASAMKHGIAIQDDHGWLFIETASND